MKLLAYKVAGATALAAVWVASAGASDGHGYRSSEHREDSGDKKGGYTKEVKQQNKKAESTSYKAMVPVQKHEAVKYEAPSRTTSTRRLSLCVRLKNTTSQSTCKCQPILRRK